MRYDPTEYRKLGQASFQGRPVLKEHMERKQEVVFDPADHSHRQIVRAMFIEGKMSDVPYRFKLEPPYASIKAMVHAKIFHWYFTKSHVW